MKGMISLLDMWVMSFK